MLLLPERSLGLLLIQNCVKEFVSSDGFSTETTTTKHKNKRMAGRERGLNFCVRRDACHPGRRIQELLEERKHDD